nr:retrovirus-related Pol polyprotein from transposon TNT 1-94 [Tanacetum cinerariifolium]
RWKKPYSHQVESAKDLLGLIHINVCGPFKIMSRQGAYYFVTFTDDYSRYGYVYLLKHKHEVFETFKVFQKEVENQLRKTIKSLRSDRGASRSLEDLEIILEEDTHPSLDTSLNHKEDDQEIDEPQIDLPPNGKPIGHNWLFKNKIDMDGVVQTYKARLVAKGFTQTPGIDYEETFSPVADIRDIRILIAITTFYDYEIWQMDVKTDFLNKYLNQESSKRGTIPMQEKLKFSKSQGASTPAEVQRMQNFPYASAVGSIMYAVRCTRPDVAEINRDPVSSGERERIGALKKNKDEGLFLSKVFISFLPGHHPGLHIALRDGLDANMFHGVKVGSPGTNMGHIINWNVLIDHFKARLTGWKANILSIGGRLTLIKSVLESKFSMSESGEIDPSSLWVKQDMIRLINMGRSQAEFVSLLGEVRDMEIDNDSESCIWSLSYDGDFSISNAWKHIDDYMLRNLLPCTTWYKFLPRMVNIFMRRLFLDRLSHRLNLSSRGLDIDSILCPICNGQVESNIYIFFSYDTAYVVWRLVCAWSDYKIPILSSCEDLVSWLLSWCAFKDSKDRAYVIFFYYLLDALALSE